MNDKMKAKMEALMNKPRVIVLAKFEANTCNGCNGGTAVCEVTFKSHVISLCPDCAGQLVVILPIAKQMGEGQLALTKQPVQRYNISTRQMENI